MLQNKLDVRQAPSPSLAKSGDAVFWKKKTGDAVSYGNDQATINLYNAGVGFLQVGNVGKAIEVFSELAEREHPSAMFNLALLFAQGHGPRLMLSESPELFLKAAKLGHEGAATHSAHFTQFQRGFQPPAGASKLLQIVGDGSCPVLLIHAMGLDILLRLENRSRASIYVSQEIFDIIGDDGKGDEFIKLMNYHMLSFGEIFKDVEGDVLPDGSPELMSRNIKRMLDNCVAERNMTEETAFIH